MDDFEWDDQESPEEHKEISDNEDARRLDYARRYRETL